MREPRPRKVKQPVGPGCGSTWKAGHSALIKNERVHVHLLIEHTGSTSAGTEQHREQSLWSDSDFGRNTDVYMDIHIDTEKRPKKMGPMKLLVIFLKMRCHFLLDIFQYSPKSFYNK